MRRSSIGLEAVADRENLALAFHATCKGKALDPSMLAFRADLGRELEWIRETLLDQSFTFGPYRSFEIQDPKPRTIHAAPFRDRVVHHAIIQVTDPVFESFQIFDSYACRKGKGTQAAVLRAFAFARSNPWYLKLDVRKYYDSIDHSILFSLLERKFKDPGLLYLMYRLLDSYHSAPGKGLPIGNLTSQHWANHYLAFMDHHVKDELRIPAYVRYMDDMVVFSNDKVKLLDLRPRLAGFLEERLALALKIADIGTLSRGLPFLGFTIKDSGIYLSKRSRDRFRAKLTEIHVGLENARLTESEAQARATSLIAFTLIARARRFRQSVLASL